jgi:hypothetical protein
MKKIAITLLLFIGLVGYSQTNGITYQAIILNPSGEQLPGVNNTNAPLANKYICLKFSIIDNNSQSEYIETVQTTTDEFGMVNLVIGTGVQIGGYASSFSNILWNANPKRLKVDLSTTGICSYYTEISNQPFTAVPFALYAVNSESAAALAALQATVTANATATTAALALKEDAANKSTTTTLGTSNVLFPTQNAVKTYVDTNISTVNTSNTALQATVAANATATTAALALKEDAANKSTTTTLGTSNVLFPTQNAVKTYVDTNISTVNTSNTALQATVAANASATTAALALKEDAANKSTTTTLGTSNVLFPTQNAVKTYVDSQVASATIPDANTTTKGKIQLAGDLGGTAALPTVPGLAIKENSANKSTVATLGTSDVLFPTQNAVKTYVDNQVLSATIADADATTKGKIQLAGDLSGTAAAPVIANNAITTSKILDANVTDAKIVTVSGSKVTGNITGSAASVTGVVPVSNGGTGQTTIPAVKSILGLTGTKVAIGADSGTTNQGTGAVGVGNGTGQTNQGSQSVAIGYVAGNSNQGANSVAIGSNAAQGGQGTQSVAIGLAANSSANNATALGAFASAGHTNATAIGYQAVTFGNNTIQLGSDGVTIPGSTAITNVKTSGTLTAGAVTYPNTHGSTGQVLSTTGSGTLTWVAPNASSLSGTVAVTNGGTGATTATGALTNLGAAPLASPIFTGTPAAPTATAGSNTTQIATTEFVTGAVALATITDATTTAKGKLQLAGDLAGTADAPTVPGLALKAPIASPTFTGTVTAPIYASTPQALTDAATIDWNPANGLNASVTLGGNRTLNFTTTPALGSYGTLIVTQDATGGRTINLPSTSNKVLGSTSTTTIALSSAANAKDILNFYYDGTNCYWNIGQGYGTAATVVSTNLASDVSGTLPVNNGGTGSATLTGYVKGNGTSAMTANSTIPLADVVGAAPIASPIFTGTPEAPTALAGTNTTQVATTAFVSDAINLKENSVNKSTTTTLGSSDVLFPTQNAVKTYVDNQIASATIVDADATTKGKLQLAGDLGGTAVAPTVPALALKAPIASPTFTGAVTAPIYASTPQALTDAATIAWNPSNGLNASVTLGGNRTLSFTATPTIGSYGTLVITQDATGGRTITLPSTANKVLGSTSTTTVTLSSAAGAKDILNFYYDGTNCYWNVGQGYGTAATVASTNLASSVSGTLPIANGGTGSATQNFVDLTTNQNISGNKNFNNNIGIGTTSNYGNSKLHIAGNGLVVWGGTGTLLDASGNNHGHNENVALTVDGKANNDILQLRNTAPNTLLVVDKDGNMGIGNTAPSQKLEVTGNIKSSGTVTAGTVTYPNTHNSIAGQVLTTNATGIASWANALPSKLEGTGFSGSLLVGHQTTGDITGVGAFQNTGVGVGALVAISNSAIGNTATGYQSLQSVTNAQFNTAMGYRALKNVTTSLDNTAFGSQSLMMNTGTANTAIGNLSLLTNTTGNNNTAIGASADVSSANLTNATAIGFNAKVATSNTIQLGNVSVANVQTSGTLTAGSVTYPNTHGTANQVLSTNGSGTLAWVTPVSSAASLTGTLAVANGGTGLSTTPTNGQIDIGNGTGFTRATLTAGTAITITNTAGAITISAAVRPTTDQATATAAQTSFTLAQTPLNAKVWMFINGVRTNNLAYSVSGTTVTYVPASNNSYVLVAGDRIQFDYAY